jgi:ParB-like chromosome segregation protein Spo0J
VGIVVFIQDLEFKNLIPPLAKEEYEQLEENILKEGISEPIVLWNGIIIDGNNRYKIAQAHNLEYKTISMDFKERIDVIIWVIRNQMGRRNLNDYNRSVLALELETIIADKAKERQKLSEGRGVKGVQNSAQVKKTRDEVAKIARVSHDTIAKVKVIEKEGSEEVKDQLKKREISINKAYGGIRKNNNARTCTICGKEKPANEFSTNYNECRICATSRKSAGITAEQARKLNEKFPDEELNAMYEEMKNPHPSEEEHGKNICKSIISDFEKLLNSFNTNINKFTFMESQFQNAKNVKPLIEANIKNLEKIINFIKE